MLLRCPQLHVQSEKDHNGEENDPRGVGPRGWTLNTIRVEGARSPHTSSHPNYTRGTMGINNCGGSIHWSPFRYWSNLPCAYWIPWLTFPLICFHDGILWMSQMLLFQLFSKLQLGLCCFHTSFWLCQSFPHPFREGYTEQGPHLCFYKYGTLFFSPINWKNI